MFRNSWLQRGVIASTLAIATVVWVSAPSLAEPSPDPANTLVNQVQNVDASLVAIKQRILSLEAAAERAGAWEDPRFGFDYSNMPIDRWAPGGHPMSGLQFSLKQTFLFPGKQRLRQAVVQGQRQELRHEMAERRWQLRNAVLKAYYRLALVRHLREVTERHITLVDRFIVAVRSKYEVGRTGQHDLLRLQVLARKLRDDLENFGRDDEALLAAINAARRTSLAQAVATPAQLTAFGPKHQADDLIKLAAQHRPLLQRFRQVEKTRAEAAKLGAREGYPDITTSIGYRVRSASGTDEGTDFISLGLSLPIPVFYGSRASSVERKQRELAGAAKQQWQATVDQLRGELGRVVAAWKRAASEAKTYRKDLTPLAKQALNATFAAYQVDRADFASLFQTELELLNFERTIRRAEAQASLLQVEAEALTGTALKRRTP